MGTAVARQETEGKPAAIEVFGCLGDEASDVVAPERESAETKRESTSQVAYEASVCRGSVATPMQRITL